MAFSYEAPKKIDGTVTITISEGVYRALYNLVGESSITKQVNIGTEREDAVALEQAFIHEWDDPSDLK